MANFWRFSYGSSQILIDVIQRPLCCSCSTLMPPRFVAVSFLFYIFIAVGPFINVVQARDDNQESDWHATARSRDHFNQILLRNDPSGLDDENPVTKNALKELHRIYGDKVQPLEELFRYSDLRRNMMNGADIHSKPIVLVVGPWSTGKTTMINYILGIENTIVQLYTGAEPTTADFTVISYGDSYRWLEGVVLATDFSKPFANVEKFGQSFLEHLVSIEMPAPLLRNVTFVDTPGILENRRQQERGYPYSEVMRWLVQRADLIFVVFDPTKLDVGFELESLFRQLKGKESAIRLVLNKADSIPEQELIRVYGALFWSLSPLINVTEAPRVYVGSLWSNPYADEEVGELLKSEEVSLLNDLHEAVANRIYNKVAALRHHAILVRLHALVVDSYVSAYRKSKPWLKFKDRDLAQKIVEDPAAFNVYKTLVTQPNVSPYDLVDSKEEYEEFFRFNHLEDQKSIGDYRSILTKTSNVLRRIEEAINVDLPKLLRQFQVANEIGRGRSKKTVGSEETFDDRLMSHFLRTHKQQLEDDVESSDLEIASGKADIIGADTQKKESVVKRNLSSKIKIEEHDAIEEVEEEKLVKILDETESDIKETKTYESKKVYIQKPAIHRKSSVKKEIKSTVSTTEKRADSSTSLKKNTTIKYAEESKRPIVDLLKDDQIVVPPEVASSLKGVSAKTKSLKVAKRPETPPTSRIDERKCLIYRKNCQIEDKVTKQHKDNPIAHKLPAPVAEKSKCKLYRKKCDIQETSKSPDQQKLSMKKVEPPKKAAVGQENPAKRMPHRKVQSEKCLPYRKSCTPMEEDEIIVVQQAAPPSKLSVTKQEPFAPAEKCPKYRKSCGSEKPIASIKIESTVKHEETIPPVTKKEPSASTEKCPPYRKSCASGKPLALTKTETIKHKTTTPIIKQEPPSAFTEKCPPYRKNCGSEKLAASIKTERTVKQEETKRAQKMDQKENADKIPPGKLKYRKSNKDSSAYHERVETTTTSKTEKSWKFPAQEGAATLKCLLYRKSCQQEKLERKKTDHAGVSSPGPSYSKKADTSVHTPETRDERDSNCPIYRKTCASPSAAAPKISAGAFTPKKITAPQKESSEKPACTPYRKSCSSSSMDSSEPIKITPEKIVKKEESKIRGEIEVEKEESSRENDEDTPKRILDSDDDEDESGAQPVTTAPKITVATSTTGKEKLPSFNEQEGRISKDLRPKLKNDAKKQDTTAATTITTEKVDGIEKVIKDDCKIYRKSCQVKTKRKDISFLDSYEYEHSLLYKLVIILFKSGAEETRSDGKKCPLYRKSCRNDAFKSTVEVETFSVPQKQPGKVQIKSTKPIEENASLNKEEAVKPEKPVKQDLPYREHPSEPEKCLLYRKSCKVPVAPAQGVPEGKEAKLKDSSIYHQQKVTVLKKSDTESSSDAAQKCLPYRKSCPKSSSAHRTSSATTPSESKLLSLPEKYSTPDHPSKKSSPGCILYRKSCLAKPAVDSNDSVPKKLIDNIGGGDDDVVYIVDEQTGKKKKYCKKKDEPSAAATADKEEHDKSADDSLLQKIIKYLCQYNLPENKRKN